MWFQPMERKYGWMKSCLRRSLLSCGRITAVRTTWSRRISRTWMRHLRMFVSCFVIKGATIARIVSNDSSSNRWNCRKASGSSAFNSRKRLGYAPCCSLLIIYSPAHFFLLTELLRRSRRSKRITKNATLSLCLSTSAILYYMGWKYLKSYEQAVQFYWLIDYSGSARFTRLPHTETNLPSVAKNIKHDRYFPCSPLLTMPLSFTSDLVKEFVRFKCQRTMGRIFHNYPTQWKPNGTCVIWTRTFGLAIR